MKTRLWHEPNYFQFHIEDAELEVNLDRKVSSEIAEKGFSTRRGFVGVRVVSEYTTIPIDVEYQSNGVPDFDLSSWDKVVECGFVTTSGRIGFIGCAASSYFGVLEVLPGKYRFRICYGGQNAVTDDGDSADHYLIQIWSSEDDRETILKPR
ncbi:MAG: hypothetical protein AMXMBFR84_51490 [Candidatus Hydrogenedentota bacterium]